LKARWPTGSQTGLWQSGFVSHLTDLDVGHIEVNFQAFPTRFANTDRIKTQVQLA
jgi:hypothetical protein